MQVGDPSPEAVEDLVASVPQQVALGQVIACNLQDTLEQRYPDHREVAARDPLGREIDQHQELVATAVHGFIDREGDFDELDHYLVQFGVFIHLEDPVGYPE